MAVVFQRRLAMPVWVVAFFTIALTAQPAATLMPPAAVVAIAAVGIAVIAFLMPAAITRWRRSRSLVRVVPSEYPNPASARIVAAARTGVRKLYKSNATEADDALDLVRMDDDGGWQMPPPAAPIAKKAASRP